MKHYLNKNNSKAAFTLAEVLITLGIIGVVAAITMPVLIQNHRKHVVETRLKKFYSTINQAIGLAEAEFGERENWSWSSPNNGLTDYEWFNKYLAKYIKTLKVDLNGSYPVVYFPDGSLAEMSRFSVEFYPEAKDYEYCKSLERPQECSGKKSFSFLYVPESAGQEPYYKYVNRLVEPYKYVWDGAESTLLGETPALGLGYVFACTKELPSNSRAYCTALIQLHGWKIPDNYPLKF